MKYVCNLCGWVYDEEEAGVKWEDLPDETSPASSAAPARTTSQRKSKTARLKIMSFLQKGTG